MYKIYTVNYKFHIKPWQPWFQDEDQSPSCQLQELQALRIESGTIFVSKSTCLEITEWMEIRVSFGMCLNKLKNWSSTNNSNNSNSLHVMLLSASHLLMHLSDLLPKFRDLHTCQLQGKQQRSKEAKGNQLKSEYGKYTCIILIVDWCCLRFKSYIAAING